MNHWQSAIDKADRAELGTEYTAPGTASRPRPGLDDLIADLATIRRDMLGLEARLKPQLDKLDDSHQASARNLVHYLVLRKRDLRDLQERLARVGLSSLGRAESHVLANVNAVLSVLHKLADREPLEAELTAAQIDFVKGKALLKRHAEDLLGPAPANRGVRILVTLPVEAADDYTLVHDLVERGMDCARINCAHDTPDVWARMIANVRRAERSAGRKCPVLMDLAGPKLRTGPVEPGPTVVKVRPQRDAFGSVAAHARLWLTPAERPAPPPTPADAVLCVPAEWAGRLREGDVIEFHDVRGKKRVLTVLSSDRHGHWARCDRTAYLAPGIALYRRAREGEDSGDDALLGDLPPREGYIVLHAGDTLLLEKDPILGRSACHDEAKRLLFPACISCTLPEVIDAVNPSERIWFDDGKIGGVVRSAEPDRLKIEISHARPGGEKLRGDKGINLPDSDLSFPALTAKDLEDLKFVAAHADAVALSFVRSAADVYALDEELAKLGAARLGIILKIETQGAFEHLPALLLAAMRARRAGVMIARGDLAVECGYERMAEVQEEILWICEAAHVPVIWATQVLETLAKTGVPSRAEITDAAMAHRAECVMLNKGPHVVSAVKVLHDILRRMQDHQMKKRPMLRRLSLADRFSGEERPGEIGAGPPPGTNGEGPVVPPSGLA